MARKFAASRRFQALDHAAAMDGWKLVMLTRISPILPHSLVSCAFGLSRISFLRFLFASWVGFLPISAAYAYGGAVIGRAAKGGLHQGPWAWSTYTVELAITVLITIWITRIAKKALRSYAPEVAEAIAEGEAKPSPSVPEANTTALRKTEVTGIPVEMPCVQTGGMPAPLKNGQAGLAGE